MIEAGTVDVRAEYVQRPSERGHCKPVWGKQIFKMNVTWGFVMRNFEVRQHVGVERVELPCLGPLATITT